MIEMILLAVYSLVEEEKIIVSEKQYYDVLNYTIIAENEEKKEKIKLFKKLEYLKPEKPVERKKITLKYL